MKTKKNNLPKSWAVAYDFSQLFKDTVLKYLNDNYSRDFSGIGELGWYYGVTKYHLADLYQSVCHFDTILTLDEFIELSGVEFYPTMGEMVEVSTTGLVWESRIFITMVNDKNCENKYLCVSSSDTKNFLDGNKYCITRWEYMRKENKIIEVDSDEAFEIIAKAKGVDKSKIKIINK